MELCFSKLQIKGCLRLRNSGNAQARFRALGVMDHPSGEGLLRKRILDPTGRMTAWHDTSFVFGQEVVDVGSTVVVTLEYTIVSMDESGSSIVHILYLYENESGGLYDSYFWIPFDNPREAIPFEPGRRSSWPILARDPKEVSRLYSPNQKKVIMAGWIRMQEDD
jgi:hypothetical protein